MKKIFFYLSERDKSLKKILVEKEELTQEFMISDSSPTIEKPQHDVKVAKAGENIFVENFLQRSQQSKKTPEYVREFEQIRLQEEDTDIINLPEYSASPSAL